MECAFHPGEETALSCGQCGRPACIECVRHTSVGTRCLECLGQREPAGLAEGGAQPYVPLFGLAQHDPREISAKAQRRYYAGLFITVALGTLLAPLVVFVGLLVAVLLAALQRAEGWPRLISGYVYFIAAWFFVVPQVLPPINEKTSWTELEIDASAAALILFAALLLLPFLWHPAKRSAVSLLHRERGFSGGLLVGTALVATAISMVGASFALILSL